MIGKIDWTSYLHTIRKREIDIIFSLLPSKKFNYGLEVGAGDGYQTTLLVSHLDKLISSDLNFKRMKEGLKVPRVDYRVIDADSLEGFFTGQTFDLIFSSNVLEHLRDPLKFLITTRALLSDDSYAVHIVPSRQIKIFYLLFYYPNLILLGIDRVWGKLKGQPFFKGANINLENNINNKIQLPKTFGRIRKFLIPSLHGNFFSHKQEFIAYGQRQWKNLFKQAGYSVYAYARGPMFSGYGFGFSRFRQWLEVYGGSAEHIFILKKMSPFELTARDYVDNFLTQGSNYEREKLWHDWQKKEKSAKAFVVDFTSAVGLPQGKKILDVGFGNGIILAEFARAGAIVSGLETENLLLNFATKYCEDNNLAVNLMIYDGRSFPFPDNTFDYCYSTSVLEHMSYPQKVLNEIFRTLIPGGKFYLSFPNRYAPKESHTGIWFISWLPSYLARRILKCFNRDSLGEWNLHFISYFSFKRMARKAGLRIVYNTYSQPRIRRWIKKMLAFCGVHYSILLKTIIIVLEKPFPHD